MALLSLELTFWAWALSLYHQSLEICQDLTYSSGVETIAINLKERNFTKLVSQIGDVFVAAHTSLFLHSRAATVYSTSHSLISLSTSKIFLDQLKIDDIKPSFLFK